MEEEPRIAQTANRLLSLLATSKPSEIVYSKEGIIFNKYINMNLIKIYLRIYYYYKKKFSFFFEIIINNSFINII